jgi:hypothetical protein
MTNEDLNKVAEILPILAKYPSNYQAKSVMQQVQRLLNNNQGNRFKLVTNSKGGILQPEPKTTSQIIEDKRVSLLEAKQIREEGLLNEEPTNVLATSEDKPKRFKRVNKPPFEND